MQRGWISSLLLIIFSFFLLSILVFALSSYSSGDITLYVLSENSTEELSSALRESSGLERPFIIRYLDFIRDFFTLDWGENLQGYSIRDLIFERAGVSAKIMALTLLFSLPFSVAASCFSIKKEKGALDRSSDLFVLLAYSLPSFSISLFLLLLFSFYIPIFPSSGYRGIRSLILPSLSLAIMHSSLFIRVFKKSLKREMEKSYITGAVARGKRREYVVFTKALRPASLSLIALLGESVSTLIAGSAIVETVFSLPGVGSLIVTSALQRDSKSATIIIMLCSIVVTLSAIISNIIIFALDPRSRGQSYE